MFSYADLRQGNTLENRKPLLHIAQFSSQLSLCWLALRRPLSILQCGQKHASSAATGAGSDQPIAENTTEEGKAMNRRVEIVLSR